jgi:hypothetical protein
VINSAGLPLNGAVVESVDGRGTRASALTDGGGHYELRIASAGALTVRASKEGYVSAERTVDLPSTTPADFVLAFTAQSAALRGDYKVALAADDACVQLPAAVRTRIYDASITPRLADYYQGELRDEASRGAGSFVVRVEGGLATFAADDSETFVHERLGASAFLTVFFVASRAPSGTASFTVPMAGTFDYCADVSPDNGFQCRVPLVTCKSSNHTFTLTAR